MNILNMAIKINTNTTTGYNTSYIYSELNVQDLKLILFKAVTLLLWLFSLLHDFGLRFKC